MRCETISSGRRLLSHRGLFSKRPLTSSYCLPATPFGGAETQSIKNNKLCETNPISEMPKMAVTLVITMTNDKKQRTMNYSKQTQSNPILSRAQSRDLLKQLSALPDSNCQRRVTSDQQLCSPSRSYMAGKNNLGYSLFVFFCSLV